jgi:hypothetical protein
MTAVRLLSLLLGVCFAGVAEAQTPWNVPASSCIPAGGTINAHNYRTNNASVEHAPGTTGQIVLNCQMERFDSGGGFWALQMLYRDSTGTDAAASVLAQIFSMDTNPSSTATPVLLTTVSSNSSSVTTTNAAFSFFSHTFNFEANNYWARVILTRNATNQTVIFHSLKIQASFPPSDIRLKHDIALLGHLDNGLGFYRFSYNGSDKAYVGLMAQEVEAIRPDAVVRGEDGYLRVLYDQLGLRMQSWEEWIASGRKIPATAPLAR